MTRGLTPGQVACPEVRPGKLAVFQTSESAVACVAEVRDAELWAEAGQALGEAAAAAVERAHGLFLEALVPLPPGRIPKTTSGKVRRAECKELFLRGALPAVASYAAPAGAGAGLWEELVALPSRAAAAEVLEAALVAQLRDLLPHAKAAAISPRADLLRLGLDSTGLLRFHRGAEKTLGRPLPLAAFVDAPNVRALAAQALAQLGQGDGAAWIDDAPEDDADDLLRAVRTVTDAAAPKAAPGQSGGAARPGWRRAAGALQVAFAVALALHVYVLRPVRVDGEPVSWVRQTPAELFAFEPTRADMSVWGPGRSPLKVRVCPRWPPACRPPGGGGAVLATDAQFRRTGADAGGVAGGAVRGLAGGPLVPLAPPPASAPRRHRRRALRRPPPRP